MSVTEKLMGAGSWSFDLTARAPAELINTIKFLGHIVITREYVDPQRYDDTAMKSIAAYTGVVESMDWDGASLSLSGSGVAFWLGGKGGSGYVYKQPREYAPDVLYGAGPAAPTITQVLSWRAAANPGRQVPAVKRRYGLLVQETGRYILTPGTITDPTSGASTFATTPSDAKSFRYTTPMKGIQVALASFADVSGYTLEWRANPDGTIDFGQQSALFVATPTCVISRTGGWDPAHKMPPLVTKMQTAQDIEDYATQVVVTTSGSLGEVQVAYAPAKRSATGYTEAAHTVPSNVESKNLLGDTVIRHYVASLPALVPGQTQGFPYAKYLYEQHKVTSPRVAMSLAQYDMKGDFKVGDMVNIWDPDGGMIDTTNPIWWEGRYIYPKKQRVFTHTWNITDGMGVYYRSGAGVYTDLTRYVDFEEDDTRTGAERDATKDGKWRTKAPDPAEDEA